MEESTPRPSNITNFRLIIKKPITTLESQSIQTNDSKTNDSKTNEPKKRKRSPSPIQSREAVVVNQPSTKV